MAFADVLASKIAARQADLLAQTVTAPQAMAGRYIAAAAALNASVSTEADLLAAFAAADAALRDLSALPAAATVLAALPAGRGGLSSSGWTVAADTARQFNRGGAGANNPLLPSVT